MARLHEMVRVSGAGAPQYLQGRSVSSVARRLYGRRAVVERQSQSVGDGYWYYTVLGPASPKVAGQPVLGRARCK